MLDEHNRWKVIQKHNLSFEVVEATGLNDRLDVKTWMINNQIGKRNLTTYQKSELALKMVQVESEKAKQRQLENLKVGDKFPVAPDLVQRENEEDKERALVLAAKKAGVGTEFVLSMVCRSRFR